MSTTIQEREATGAEFVALLDSVEQLLDSDKPGPKKLRRDAAALRQVSGWLEELAAKLDDLATLREFSERVGLDAKKKEPA